ncbi:MAG: hypothetical protein EXS05_15170 [Planctomycetaceae bacterium]|nr:hypothetical protein [Planctomycetaceae bacterium]
MVVNCHLLEVVRRRIATNERIIGFRKLAANHRVLVQAIASDDPELVAHAMHGHLAAKTTRPS